MISQFDLIKLRKILLSGIAENLESISFKMKTLRGKMFIMVANGPLLCIESFMDSVYQANRLGLGKKV